MKKPYIISLDLYEKTVKSTENCYVQGDSDVYPLYIKLLRNGDAFTLPAGAVISINFENKKTGIISRGIAEIEDAAKGVILYNFLGSEICVDGEIIASVVVQNADKRLTWQKFKFNVDKSLDDGRNVAPTKYVPWTAQIDAEISKIKKEINSIQVVGGILEIDEVKTKTLEPEEPANVNVTVESGKLNFTFQIPKGEPGKDGTSGGGGSLNQNYRGIHYLGDSITSAGRNGVAISSIVSDGNGKVTVTLTAAGSFEVGDSVTIEQVQPVEFEGDYIIKEKTSTTVYVLQNSNAPAGNGSMRQGLKMTMFSNQTNSFAYTSCGEAIAGKTPESRNSGIDGKTIAQLIEDLDRKLPTYTEEYMHVLIGVNSLYVLPVAECIAQYKQLIEKLKADGRKIIIGALTPVTSGGNASRQDNILEFNAWLKKYAMQNNFLYADYFGALVNRADANALGITDYFAADGLHPNFTGQRMMGEELAKILSVIYNTADILPVCNGLPDNLLKDALLLATPKTISNRGEGQIGSEYYFENSIGHYTKASIVPREDGYGNNCRLEMTLAAAGYTQVKPQNKTLNITGQKAKLSSYINLKIMDSANVNRISVSTRYTINGVNRDILAFNVTSGNFIGDGEYTFRTKPLTINETDTITLTELSVMFFGAQDGATIIAEMGRHLILIEDI